jgi:hypothetical protein
MLFEKSKIKVLQLEPTVDCNAACPQCPRYHLDGLNPYLPHGELTIGKLQQRLGPGFVSQLEKMFMCGNFGEPAMAKHTLEIFAWFRAINESITLGMNTNGSLRSTSWWQSLARVLNRPNDYVVFSIDGLEDTNHVYRQNTVWARIETNVKAFIDAGGTAHWDMLVFEHNQHQIDQVVETARSMGFKWLRLKVSKRFDTRPVSWLSPPKDYHVPQDLPEVRCDSVVNSTVYMDSNGSFFPCCYVADAVYSADQDATAQQVRRLLDFDRTHDLDLDHLIQQAHWENFASPKVSVCRSNCTMKTTNLTAARSQWVREIEL